MKTFLVLCLITTLAMVVTWVDARLHNDHYDNNAVNKVSDKKINARPCMINSNNNAYNQFRNKHILDRNFNPTNIAAWRDYLISKGLCGRVPVQSFFQSNDEQNVINVCRKQGRRATKNLCVSTGKFTVFNVNSTAGNSGCSVTSVRQENQNVILGCDKVDNLCLPVHYEVYNGETPGTLPCNSNEVYFMHNIL